MRQRASNWFCSPKCGVADSKTTIEARQPSASTAASRPVPGVAPCASSTTRRFPAHRFQGAEHLRPFDEVDGRQVDARNRPGVHVRGQFARDRPQPRGVRVDRQADPAARPAPPSIASATRQARSPGLWPLPSFPPPPARSPLPPPSSPGPRRLRSAPAWWSGGRPRGRARAGRRAAGSSADRIEARRTGRSGRAARRRVRPRGVGTGR